MSTPNVKELPRHLEPVTRDTFIDRLADEDRARPEPVPRASTC